MARALLAVLLVASAPAASQPEPAPTPAARAPAADSPATTGSADARLDEIRRELEQKFERKLEEAKAAMREEMRAQLAAQSAAEGFSSEMFLAPRKHLEVFVPHGYLRVRPDLFNKFDLNREPDPTGAYLWPRSPYTNKERTQAGVNMRFRFEPTLNISEDVRVQAQIDVLDNLVFGSTPDYAYSRSNRNQFSIFSETAVPPISGINAVQDSIMVKRVWGEVNTPIGIFRFGRMGSQFGLGILHNDGNCLNCDFGETVDRLQFVIEPVAGFFITPMLDFNVEGPTSQTSVSQGQPFDLSNSDDAHSLVLAAARRDTDAQARAKLESGQSVLNYGFYFTYRFQHNDAVNFYKAPFQGAGGDLTPLTLQNDVVFRGGQLYIPDLWFKFERKNFRIELELAGVFGKIGSRALNGAASNSDPGQTQALDIIQFGGVLQAEYRLFNDSLRINAEVGFASGDKAPGFGNYPNRPGSGPDGSTAPGDFEGPQYSCQNTGSCTDHDIRNFRFNRDYRIDLILWREILGGLTDAVYLRPSASYTIASGFDVFAAVIYSRAFYKQSTPSAINPAKANANLGIEIDAGAQYTSEDGFFAGVQYGILFPLTGLTDTQVGITPNKLDNAQAVRGYFGVKF
jgi:uncharacterized protein (TIGR04551 family)